MPKFEARQSLRGSYWFVDEKIGGEGYSIATDMSEERAKRIAAALNAVEGISTEALEIASSFDDEGDRLYALITQIEHTIGGKE